ncbi:unnamed protein product [Chrysoparadoxa australica]
MEDPDTTGGWLDRGCMNPLCLEQPEYGYKYLPASYCKAHSCDDHEFKGPELIAAAEAMAEAKAELVAKANLSRSAAAAAAKAEGSGAGSSEGHSCWYQGCKTRPTYGYSAGNPTACDRHRLDDMKARRLRTTECNTPGCSKRSIYGYAKEDGAVACQDHKTSAMTALGLMCGNEDCCRFPQWGYPGTKATHCGDHYLEGMFNWAIKCSRKGCNKVWRFGPQGSATPSVCIQHKTDYTCRDFKKGPQPEGAIPEGAANAAAATSGTPSDSPAPSPAPSVQGVNGTSGVKRERSEGAGAGAGSPSDGDKKRARANSVGASPSLKNGGGCEVEGCKGKATYGRLAGCPVACSKHKQEGMKLRRRARPQCSQKGCQKKPVYADNASSQPLSCELHKSPGMVSTVPTAAKSPAEATEPATAGGPSCELPINMDAIVFPPSPGAEKADAGAEADTEKADAGAEADAEVADADAEVADADAEMAEADAELKAGGTPSSPTERAPVAGDGEGEGS